MGRRGAVFVLPGTTTGQQGPVAAWVSVAGWAAAARRVLGESWIETPSGPVTPEEARRHGSHPRLASRVRPVRRLVPTIVKTAAKDVRQWRRGKRFHVPLHGPWDGTELAFVWQRHELFHTAGLDLARRLRVPSVLFVPATLVWESAQWGVGRPGREWWLERFGEQPALRAADLVACGTEPVADQVRRLGVGDDRIIVTPTGVDLDLFDEVDGAADGAARRRALGLDDRFVIGWVGSFRRFHALDLLVEAARDVDGATLLLIGDGPERPRIERLAADAGVAAVFTGTVEHTDLPAYLAAVDVAAVVAAPDQVFHYSPLKLAEYLAAGLPVVAPRVAQLEARLTDGVDALLVPPGDPRALAGALRSLRADPDRRRRLGRAARAAARTSWSWDGEVRHVLDALDGRRPTGR
jgi:glycosyltransferase involved in cell wall biosynthesis